LLAEAGALHPGRQYVNPDHLLPLAYSFATEIYPELLRPAVNSVPLAMTWMDGFSGYSRRLRFGFFELLHRRKSILRSLCWWTSFWALVLPVILVLARVVLRTQSLDNVLFFVMVFAPLSVLVTWGGAAFLFGVDAVAGIGKRRRDRWRKQLAAIL